MYPYTLIRSSRRTLALEIRPDLSVVVRAPWYLPLGEIERFVQSRAGWIDLHLERQRRRMQAHPEPTPEQEGELIRRAETELPGRVAFYAARMGVNPAGIRITGARTRFGSCSAKNRLCFSWRLMQYPEPAIDYVVVHELAHIVYKNHGPEFYALVASILPDHIQRRALLRR